MPPTGLHGLIGLTVSSNISKKKENERIAVFFGSVFPDLDIFGSIIIFFIGLLQGVPLIELRESVVLFHRSVTHSLFLISFLAGGGLIFYFLKNRSYEKYGKILIYFSIGITIHVLFDFFYLDGVSIFWPFFPERVYLPLNLPILEQLPENFQRFYSAIDIAFDGVYWIIFARLINKTNSNMSSNVKNMLMKRKSQLIIGGIMVIVFFTIFALFGLFTEILMMNEFVVLIYIPGMIVLFISCFIPLFFRKTVINIEKLPNQWIKRNKG